MSKQSLALQAEQRILILRDQKVMLDFHLAELYGVETRALKQAVRRNPERFPEDFMFELDPEEAGILVSQSVIPGLGKLGGAAPMAFTEQGVAMLSSVLRSMHGIMADGRVAMEEVAGLQGWLDDLPRHPGGRRLARPRQQTRTTHLRNPARNLPRHLRMNDETTTPNVNPRGLTPYTIQNVNPSTLTPYNLEIQGLLRIYRMNAETARTNVTLRGPHRRAIQD